MYTSYSGMRSTGGAEAPSASRLRRCVLAATPSLGTLMHLSIGVVRLILAAGTLLREPGVETRRHEAVGALLRFGGPRREEVGILVLGRFVVAAHPLPLHRQPLHRLIQFLPQR